MTGLLLGMSVYKLCISYIAIFLEKIRKYFCFYFYLSSFLESYFLLKYFFCKILLLKYQKVTRLNFEFRVGQN